MEEGFFVLFFAELDKIGKLIVQHIFYKSSLLVLLSPKEDEDGTANYYLQTPILNKSS